MENRLRIVSTKKLLEPKRQQLLSADFLVFDESFIEIRNKSFVVNTVNDYLIFTSKNAVESVLGSKYRSKLRGKKCFVVGTKTKILLEQNGFEVLVHSEYAAELASIIFNQFAKNSFTFFCGNIRKDVLPDALRLAKITLEELTVYETFLTTHKLDFIPDGVLFFSPSAAESYMQENRIEDEICFCIGNTTAEALKYATPNLIIANQPTIESTILKCIEYYKN